jgi:Tripartite ATP-independent periplasmic transporters, DctQ component
MQKLLLAVDKLSTVVGKAFSWLILLLTLMITWEVFSRYVLDNPHPWAFDVMSMMYGTLFMTAGAYTLSQNGHVRGDVLYGFFPPRLQAGLDLALYLPGRAITLPRIPGPSMSTRISLPMAHRFTHSKPSFRLPERFCSCKVWSKLCVALFACSKAIGLNEATTWLKWTSKN